MLSGSDSLTERGRLSGFRRVLEIRSRTLQALRRWFIENGFIEVETPVRIPTPALELHIDAVASGDHFLRTSPEMHMKRLVAAGHERIFQLGPCFREGEMGHLHNPEYTMLEWYRAPGDYAAVLEDAQSLIPFVGREVLGIASVVGRGRGVGLEPPWTRISVSEAFSRYAGWDPVQRFDPDRFDADLVAKVEPALPKDTPVILSDYPIAAGALARAKPGDARMAERWELYVGGIELANAFSELTDAVEQRRRFDEWAEARRRMGKPVYRLDEEFLAALEPGMPPCGGVALGVDRLVMILAGAASLDDVLPFRTACR